MHLNVPPVVTPAYTPRSSVPEFVSLCSYPHSVFNLCQSDGCELTFIVILICISMMTSEFQNPFKYSPIIQVSSIICLFVLFVPFSIGLSFCIGSRCSLNVL